VKTILDDYQEQAQKIKDNFPPIERRVEHEKLLNEILLYLINYLNSPNELKGLMKIIISLDSIPQTEIIVSLIKNGYFSAYYNTIELFDPKINHLKIITDFIENDEYNLSSQILKFPDNIIKLDENFDFENLIQVLESKEKNSEFKMNYRNYLIEQATRDNASVKLLKNVLKSQQNRVLILEIYKQFFEDSMKYREINKLVFQVNNPEFNKLYVEFLEGKTEFKIKEILKHPSLISKICE